MGKTWINHNGVWKESYPKVNHNGIWKQSKPWVNHYGVWKKAFPGGMLCIGTNGNKLHRIDPDNGTTIWTYSYGDDVDIISIDPAGNIYFGTNNNDDIDKIDSNSNHIWWKSYGVDSFWDLTNIVFNPYNGYLYAGWRRNRFAKINPSNGNVVWSKALPDGEEHSSYDSGDRVIYNDYYYPITSIKVGTDENVYVSNRYTIYKVNPMDESLSVVISIGHSKFTFDLYSIYTIYYDDYQTFNQFGNKINKYDITTHDLIITFQFDRDIHDLKFNQYDGYLYAIVEDDYLYKINPTNGNVVWSHSISGYNIRRCIEIDSYGYIYIAGTNNVLYKLNTYGSVIWSWSDPQDNNQIKTIVYNDLA